MNNMNPKIYEALLKNNMITTTQVLALGFSKQVLSNYVREGLLTRVRQGLICCRTGCMTICIR